MSETFRRHEDAKRWALSVERSIDLGESPTQRSMVTPTTLRHLIELHNTDMCEVGRAPRRSKAFTLDALKQKLGHVRVKSLTRERLIQFGKDRSKEGAGPVTIGMDLGYIKLVISHAAAVHGLQVSSEPVDLARIALKRLGLIGKGRERDRRPTRDEIDRLLKYFEGNFRQIIPIGRIVRFAIATAMRLDEICSICWSDLDQGNRTVIVRDRKDPRHKTGNDQRVPLLDATGIDAWEVLQEQWPFSRGSHRVFPYNSRSVGTAFRRGCRELKIGDLRFHDLRHEAASRLFEAGFNIEHVALVTGHRDWKMLKRYTNLRPEDLLKRTARRHSSTDPAPTLMMSQTPTREALSKGLERLVGSQNAPVQNAVAPNAGDSNHTLASVDSLKDLLVDSILERLQRIESTAKLTDELSQAAKTVMD